MSSNIVVSLNKIAEFAYAPSHRRMTIVKQHKNRKKGPSVGYREAENFLPRWINQQLCPTLLHQQLQALSNLQTSLQGFNPQSGYVKGINNGVNALTWLTQIGSLPLPAGTTLLPCEQFATDGLKYGNVLVKARPNALIVLNDKRKTRVGALKFHFSKSTSLSPQAGDLASVALFEYLNQCTPLPGSPHPSLCHSVDAYTSSIRTAPNGHMRLHQELVDACSQYEMIWNSIP